MQAKGRSRGVGSIAAVVAVMLLLLMGCGSSGAASSTVVASRSTDKTVRTSGATKYDARYCKGTVPTLAEVQLLGMRALSRCVAP